MKAITSTFLCALWLGFIILFACYALPGLFTHAPWKPDDAVHIGLAYNQIKHGLSLFPSLAGVPWVVDGQLPTWISAFTADILAPFWPFQTVGLIRLPNILYLGVLLGFAALIGKKTNPSWGAIALPLLILGSVGLLVPAHEAGIALFVAMWWMVSYFGLTHSTNKPLLSGSLCGISISAVILTTGCGFELAVVTLMGIIGIFRKPPHDPYDVFRHTNYTLNRIIYISMLLAWALVPFGIWAWCANTENPILFNGWVNVQIGHLIPNALHTGTLIATLKVISWATFPAWPLALYTLVSLRREWRQETYVLPLLLFLVTVILMWLYGRTTAQCAILAMLPLAILGIARIHALSASLTGLLGWFSILAFTAIALYGWITWSAMVLEYPVHFSAHLKKIFPAFSYPVDNGFNVALAGALSAAWCIALMFRKKTPLKDLVNWTSGLALFWALSMWLHLPLLDHLRSYESVAKSFAATLPLDAQGCVSGIGVGAAQRASIDYFTNIELKPAQTNCDYRLIYARPGNAAADNDNMSSCWQRVGEFKRPKTKHEVYRLYHRVCKE